MFIQSLRHHRSCSCHPQASTNEPWFRYCEGIGNPRPGNLVKMTSRLCSCDTSTLFEMDQISYCSWLAWDSRREIEQESPIIPSLTLDASSTFGQDFWAGVNACHSLSEGIKLELDSSITFTERLWGAADLKSWLDEELTQDCTSKRPVNIPFQCDNESKGDCCCTPLNKLKQTSLDEIPVGHEPIEAVSHRLIIHGQLLASCPQPILDGSESIEGSPSDDCFEVMNAQYGTHAVEVDSTNGDHENSLIEEEGTTCSENGQAQSSEASGLTEDLSEEDSLPTDDSSTLGDTDSLTSSEISNPPSVFDSQVFKVKEKFEAESPSVDDCSGLSSTNTREPSMAGSRTPIVAESLKSDQVADKKIKEIPDHRSSPEGISSNPKLSDMSGADTESFGEACDSGENKSGATVYNDDSAPADTCLTIDVQPQTTVRDDDDGLKDFKEVIEAIDFVALQRVAVQVRLKDLLRRGNLKHGWSTRKQRNKQKNKKKLTCTIDERPAFGGYNIVYKITFSDGTKWAVRIPGHGVFLDEDEIEKMDYEYQAMRYIRKNTTMKIPEVFIWDGDCELIGVAFALMSWAEGRSVFSCWFDENWTTEEKRLTILTSVANNMAQLQNLRTNRIGAPRFTNDGQLSHVGPEMWFSGNNKYQWGNCQQRGPWNTVADYYEDHLEEDDYWDGQVLKHVFDSMLPDLAEPSTCCLSLHDFDSQNILVDDEGNVTAVIDWDRVLSLPASAGAARFPAWITRDWAPGMRGWSDDATGGETCTEDSPKVLRRYRKHYAAAFNKASVGIKGYDSRQVELSILMEGTIISASSVFLRQYIMKNFLHHAFDGKVPFTIPEYGAACDEGREEETYGKQIRKAFVNNLWRLN